MRSFGFVLRLSGIFAIWTAFLVAGLGVCRPAFGQTTWTGATPATWSNTSFWSTSSVPTASTAVVFTPSASGTMNIPNGVVATATSINFANTAGTTTISILDGGRLNVGGAITDTGTGNAAISVANTSSANAASILTGTSIALNEFNFISGGTQFLTMNADLSAAVQVNLGSTSGTATYRQTGGTLTTSNGGYGLTLIEASSPNPVGVATFILDGGRVSSDRIGVANGNGNNGTTVTRYAANGVFQFNSGTVQPRSGGNTFFQNGSARTSGSTTDTQLNTSKPITISLAGTGTHEFNATGGNIWITPSAQVRDQAGQAGTLLKTGAGVLYLTGDGPVAINDWTGASTVNAGLLTVDYSQIAGTATAGGTTALANAYSPSSQLVMNGGNFTLTGRPNATASSQTNRSINAGTYNLTVTSTAGLVVGQAVTNANLPAGTYIRRIINATSVELNAMITGTTNLTGQTFDFAAANFTNSQAINNVVLQQTGTVTVNPAGDSTLLTFGTVSGAAGIVKAGTGTLRLTGPLSYSGTTNLSAGTVDFAPASGTSTLAGSVVGSGTFVKSGNGTTIIGGTGNTFSGPLSITGGTLQIGTATTSNVSTQALGVTSAVTVGAGANLVFKNSSAIQNASSLLISGTIATDAAGVAGGGFINKLGNGPITMSGGAIVANTGGNESSFQSYALGGDVTVAGSSASTISVAAGAGAASAGVHLTWSTAAGTTRTFTVADATGNAAADLVVSARLINTANTMAATNLAKAGLGTMLLSGSNGYTGSTTVSAGTLDFSTVNALQNSSGVSIEGGASLRYSGSAAALSRNLTVTSGTGTVQNSGSGLLTLSGTLTKDGTVLRLTGGQFNVTGQIVGASANSDLLVDGTSTVTLSTTNSYNGPTFVNQASNLILGVNNAIPSNSLVTLGDATTTGTLTLGTFSNAIGGLAFGAGGGTLRMAASATGATAQLTAASGTMSLTNGTLDLTGSGTSAGLYRLLSAQAVTGSFSGVTGGNAGYQLLSTATSVDYQQRAVLGAITVTNPSVSIITGGSAAFSYAVANAALAGGASLSFTGSGLTNVAGSSSGSALAAGSSGSISGLVFTGTAIGAGQTGTFDVTAPTAFGTTTATGTVSVNVLDHATASLGASLLTSTTISLGTWNYATQTWESGTNAGQFSIFNVASSFGAGNTADLALLTVTGTASGFTTDLAAFADLAGGASRQFSVFFDPTGFGAAGTQSAMFTLSTSDKPTLSGATASNTLFVTANVIVVPEPAGVVLGVCGAAAAAFGLRRARRPRAT